MEMPNIVAHFNSLGLPVEQYKSQTELCEAMWESLIEDGEADSDDEYTYYECHAAAGEMWEEHLCEVARGNVKPEPDRYCASPNNPTGATLGEVLKTKLEEVKNQPEPSKVSHEVLPPLESLQEPTYVSARTRELERQLEASRARDARCVELGRLLDGLTAEDVGILHELLHKHYAHLLDD